MLRINKINRALLAVVFGGILLVAALVLLPNWGAESQPVITPTNVTPFVGGSTPDVSTIDDIQTSQPVTTPLTLLPCDPPCWEGINPGVTTVDEAKVIIMNHPDLVHGTLDCSDDLELGGCIWRWKIPWKWMEPGISWNKGIIDSIQLGLTYDLTVGEIINKYGIPEEVRIGSGGIPEHWYWIVDMYYPSEGIQFKTYTEEYSTDFTEETEVGVKYYFGPTSLENWFTILEGEPTSINRVHPWQGFGNLGKLYPSECCEWP